MGSIEHTFEEACHACLVFFKHGGLCLSPKPVVVPEQKPEKELCSKHGSLSKETTSTLCGVIRTYVLCLLCGLPIDDPVSLT